MQHRQQGERPDGAERSARQIEWFGECLLLQLHIHTEARSAHGLEVETAHPGRDGAQVFDQELEDVGLGLGEPGEKRGEVGGIGGEGVFGLGGAGPAGTSDIDVEHPEGLEQASELAHPGSAFVVAQSLGRGQRG